MLTFILDIIKRLVIYGKKIEQVHLDRSIDLFFRVSFSDRDRYRLWDLL